MTSVYASKIRMVVRTSLVCFTAFGLDISAEQVGAIQLLAEALLQLVVRDVEEEA
jgi:hypothetical protein